MMTRPPSASCGPSRLGHPSKWTSSTNRGTTVFVITLVPIILATIIIGLRLISKWGLTRRATLDDFVAIIAWLFATVLSVSIIIGTQVGLAIPDSG
jgi:hypothetical protein